MAERTPPESSSQPSGVVHPSPDHVVLAAQEGTIGPSPWVLTAKPGMVIEVPFTLASAGIELRGDDLYVHAGDLLVVVKGYGPALDAGHAPSIVDPAGDWFAAGVPKITEGTPIVLTDAPLDLPPKPGEPTETQSHATKHFGGALLTLFELEAPTGPHIVALGLSSPKESHAVTIVNDVILPDFSPVASARFLAPPVHTGIVVTAPFHAVDDQSGVSVGAAAGNVIAGLGGGTDIQIGGTVTAITAGGAPVAVTVGGIDIAGQYGTLHIADDGSVSYHRTGGDVADLIALPNNATDVFTYTLTNGDGRTDTATLTFALMPSTTVNGDATGTGDDEALVLAPGAHGTLSGLGGEDRLFGNSGDDKLDGGADNDYLAPGAGNDQVIGGSGDDTLNLAGNLNAADQLDGGGGNDRLLLDGDYSAGVTFTATTLVNVESILLADGHSYAFTLDDATNAAGLTVDGSTLTGSNALTLDGSAETSAPLTATGGTGDDVLKGGDGDDTLTGNAGDDTLGAGAGIDILSGGAGNDVFLLAGNLTAADKIDGGADNDVLQLDGNYAAGLTFAATTVLNVETIALADGNSYKLTLDDATNANGLSVDGTALSVGNSLTLDGSAEITAPLTASGGAGDDVLTGGAGNDQLSGGAGNDVLTGNAGDDTLTAGAGNDTLAGGAGNDTFDLAGNLTASDKIDGGADNDVLQLDGDYSAGVTFSATTLVNVETITVADGHSYSLTLADASNATGLSVDGSVLTGANTLTLDGSAETSAPLTAAGGAGDDVLKGGAGDDVLTGNAGDDTLAAGAGIDSLTGGAGNDIFQLAGNLTAADKIDGGADLDTLQLAGNYAAGVTFGATTVVNVETIMLADGNSYKLTLDDATNANGLTVDGSALTGANALTLDGSSETSAALTAIGGAGDDALIGGAGDDKLDGGSGNDTLTAGAGTDTLTGGAGNDTFNLGDDLTAADKIDGGANVDTLNLAGDYSAGLTFGATTMVNVENVTVAAGNSYKLVLDDATNGAGLTIDGSALAAANSLTVDGSAETSAALTATGGAGDDALTGGAGDDVLTGGAGNDTLRAGTGTDTLTGGAGNDILDVGANLTAADKIDGGADSDTLLLSGNYAAGISFTATTVTNVETIALADGNDYKLTLVDANNTTGLTVDGSALTAPHTLILDGSAETSAALTALGGAGDDQLKGGAGSDTLTGNAGNDVLTAGSGTDTLSGGAGNDTFILAANLTAADKIDGGADSDTLLLSGNYTAGVTFNATTVVNVETIQVAAGNNYKLVLDDATNSAGLTVDASALATANTLTLDGSAETSAALTATGGAGNDTISGGGGADKLDGGAGNDALNGNAGDDILTAGTGNDTMSGGAGNDTFALAGNLAAADKIDGGADSDTVQLSGNYAAGVTFTATTMVNVETITVADGNSYKLTLVDANNATGLSVDGSVLTGSNALTVNDAAETSAALVALGGAGNDALTGGAGNDTLTGNAGNDTLTGNAGNDVLVAGSGTDTLSGGAGNDTLDLGANLDAADKIDGGANTDTLLLDGDYSAGVVLGATTVLNVETFVLAAGHDYKLTLNNATNAATLNVDASALGAANVLTLDGSAETAQPLTATGGAGNDSITGGAGADNLNGGAGNDTITTGAGSDTVSGGAGNDIINLAANLTAADSIDGGADYDIVKLNGNYSAGIVLAATTIVNVEEIDLAAGNSYKLTLNDANDTAGLKIDGTLLAAGQVMTVSGAAETDASLTLLAGAGNDALTGGARDDTLDGGAGNDTLTSGAGEDAVQGGAGNDTIVMAGNLDAGDRIDGGANLDTVSLSGDYSAGVTFAATTMVNVETITLAAGNNYKLILDDATNAAGLTVTGTALAAPNTLTLDGSAELSAALTATGGAGDDTLIGGGGSDVLTGGNGNDTLAAGSGTDTLSGGNGNDTLNLGANLDAADKIDGGANLDTLTLDGDYSAGVVFGAATVVNIETIALAAGHDYKLTLNNATNAATLNVDGSALGAGNMLTLDGSAETAQPLTATGGAGNDTLIGGAGADNLNGGAGNDTITTGAGNDIVSGGAGNDIVNLAASLTAADNIDGGADYDIVKLQGNYSAGITLAATTLVNIEEIDLAAGFSYSLTLNDATNAAGLKIDGTALIAGQVMTINGAAETTAGLTALGGAANDVLTGGAGSDSLSGGAGNDTLMAGAGVDVIAGGAGNDTIVLAANLTAADQIDGGADIDTLTLNGNYSAGVTFGATTVVNVETITVTAGNSYKLVLDDATNVAGLTINGSTLAAPNFLFVDGSAETGAVLTATGGTGDDTLIGGAGSDVLSGGSGNDTLVAGTGTDTLTGGNGNDTLDLGAGLDATDKIDGGANVDTLKLNGDYSAGVTLGATTVVNVETILVAAGHDYNLTLNNATNSAGLAVDASALGSANVLILDGSAETASALTVTGGAGNDIITGGTGADVLNGGAGDDTVTAGAGNDKLSGGAGNDTFVLAANLTAADTIDGGADYDKLSLNGNYSAGVTFTATTLVNVEEIDLAAGNSYKFTLNDANDTASLTIDGSLLAAGQVLTVNGAAETASPLVLLGGAANDVLTGGAGDDTLKGGAGNDTLTVGAGADTVDGGAGNDTIVLAANLTAADKIDGGADIDTLQLTGNYAAGVVFNATTVVNVEMITVAAGNNYNLTLDDATNVAGLTISASALAAANFLTLDGSAETSAALTATGGAGNDIITGGAGADVLTAGAGIDTLSGNAGNDTFILGANLTAADKIDGGADSDTLSLNGNYSAGITFTATTLVNVETITVADGFSYKFTLHDATNTTGLDVDGSVLSTGRTLTIDGSAETGASLTVTGGAGNDTLTGGAGIDHLTGGAGNDTIKGNGGDDFLVGGLGDDTLTGGTGADTFTFNLADAGKDKVTDFKLLEGDTLEFSHVLDGPGSDLQDLIDAGVTATGSAGNCVVSWNGGASTVTLTGVGGTVTSISDLATLLGSELHVTH